LGLDLDAASRVDNAPMTDATPNQRTSPEARSGPQGFPPAKRTPALAGEPPVADGLVGAGDPVRAGEHVARGGPPGAREAVDAGEVCAIEVRGLRKSFGDNLVLDGIDLVVTEGSVFALLGPNGSGKTTTVQILTTLLPADGGTVRVAGHDVSRHPDLVRRAIGVTGQFSAVDDLLTGRENLQLMADLAHLRGRRGTRRVSELQDRFDLEEAADRVAFTYSGGMRRRLDLAMTLIGEPRIIFLDEPTTGLDPRSRHTMWEVVRELTTQGVTIFLTTQYLEEADRLATRVALLDHARIVAEGAPNQLKQHVPGGHVELRFDGPQSLAEAAGALAGVRSEIDPGTFSIRIPTDGGVRSLLALFNQIESCGVPVETVSVETADLDDVFFAVTGRPRGPGQGRPEVDKGRG
jgi:ABC-2 type transport system ATP-binding protein